MSTYKIIRFHKGDRPVEIIRTGLSLAEARAHCARADTASDDWFDGYELELPKVVEQR